MWNLLIPAATAVMGARSAERKADAQKAYNLGQAEVTRYSPWTGMSGQMDKSYAPSQMEGAFSGALQGASMAQGFGMGGGGAGAPAGGSPQTMMAGGGANLGGQDMSAQLGMQGNMFANSMQQKPNLFAKY